MTWKAETLSYRHGQFFAYPIVGEGVTVRVTGESAADVVSVANQVEARVCVPEIGEVRGMDWPGSDYDDEGPQTDEQFADLKERFAAFRASQKGKVA